MKKTPNTLWLVIVSLLIAMSILTFACGDDYEDTGTDQEYYSPDEEASNSSSTGGGGC